MYILNSNINFTHFLSRYSLYLEIPAHLPHVRKQKLLSFIKLPIVTQLSLHTALTVERLMTHFHHFETSLVDRLSNLRHNLAKVS